MESDAGKSKALLEFRSFTLAGAAALTFPRITQGMHGALPGGDRGKSKVSDDGQFPGRRRTDGPVESRYRRWFRSWTCIVRIIGIVAGSYLTGCTDQMYPGVVEAEFHGHPTTASPNFTRDSLSPAVAVGIRQYLAESTPIAFAIEEDGAFFVWWRCETRCHYDIDKALGKLVAACEAMRVGSRCYIAYAGATRSSDLQFKPVMPHRLFQAEGTQALGPDEAHGTIVYFPGFGGWNPGYHNAHARLDDAWVPPLYHALNDRGWDVRTVNIENQHDRSALWRNSEQYRKVMGAVVDTLRQKGYGRIVLAGGSRGAAEILLATADGVTPDAVIVSEPNDSGGILTREGEENEANTKQPEEMFGRISESDVPKVVLMYFESSFWTSGFSEYLDTHPVADSVFLIGKPEGLRGHAAGSSERLAGHADCFSDYLLDEIARYEDCQLPQYDAADIRYWQNRDQIIAGGLRPASAEQVAEKLSGNTLCEFDWDEQRVRLDWHCGYFGSNFRLKDSAIYIDHPYNNYGEIEYVEGGYCMHDGFSMYTDAECSDVFIEGDKVFVVSRREDDALALVVLPGNQIKTHDVVCASTSDGILCGKREPRETPLLAGLRFARSMK